MATEFKVFLEDMPGTLAHLCGVLGETGVNIEAIQGVSREGRESVVQFVPRDRHTATHALDVGGIAYSTREVLIVKSLDEPSTLADVRSSCPRRSTSTRSTLRLVGTSFLA
jgi:hypothetical protein